MLRRRTGTKKTKRRKAVAELVPGEDYAQHFETARTLWLFQDLGLRRRSLVAEGWLSRRRADGIPATILEADPVLFGLEFDRYVQPLLNREAWGEYAEQRAIADELGGEDEERLVEKPRCPLLFEWLGETEKLSIDLIAQHVYPRIDPASGRVMVTDWREMVAEKADIDVAIAELEPGGRCDTCSDRNEEPTYHGRHLHRAAQLAVDDLDLTVIASRMDGEVPQAIETLRAVDRHVRTRTRMEDQPRREPPPRCTFPECEAMGTHLWLHDLRCFLHWPGGERWRAGGSNAL